MPPPLFLPSGVQAPARAMSTLHVDRLPGPMSWPRDRFPSDTLISLAGARVHETTRSALISCISWLMSGLFERSDATDPVGAGEYDRTGWHKSPCAVPCRPYSRPDSKRSKTMADKT